MTAPFGLKNQNKIPFFIENKEMKIAVTTDLSDLTEVVIGYAVGLSKQINADLLLLHVVPSSIATGARVSSEMLKNEMKKAAKEELEQLVLKFQDDEVKIEYHTCFGNSVAELIKSIIRNHAIDFVVTGSNDIEGSTKIFGSNTIAVINNSTVPVVVVPSKTFCSR
jgi:nucleotide-binding universal stress UspA family protein